MFDAGLFEADNEASYSLITSYSTGSAFFSPVAISGDGLIMAKAHVDAGYTTGVNITVYERTQYTWTLRYTITPPTSNEAFGVSLALNSDGSTLIVGAPNATTNAKPTGAAYVFTRSGNTWVQQQQLYPTGPLSTAQAFGVDVSLSSSGDTAAIGAPQDGTNGTNAGAAWVFVRSGSTWSSQQKLYGTGGVSMRFGTSLQLSTSGNDLIVGSPSNYNGDTTAAAYVFVRSGSTWSQQTTWGYTSASADSYGWSVSIAGNGNTAIVVEAASGDIDVYTRSGTSWTKTYTLSGQAGGCSALLTADAKYIIISGSTDDNTRYAVASVYAWNGSNTAWVCNLVGSRYHGSMATWQNIGKSIGASYDSSELVISSSYTDDVVGAYHKVLV